MTFKSSGSPLSRAALALLLAAALVASASVVSSATATAPSREVTLATELLVAPNGDRTVRQLVHDPATDRWIPLADTDLASAHFTTVVPESGTRGRSRRPSNRTSTRSGS